MEQGAQAHGLPERGADQTGDRECSDELPQRGPHLVRNGLNMEVWPPEGEEEKVEAEEGPEQWYKQMVD